MKTKSPVFIVLALLALSTLNLRLSTCFAQGSLTPPGAPAPTMKTLSQIEPRTPISSAPYSITSPGSYYLTTNLTVAVGDAIDISANGVTVDLNGFTISTTGSGSYGIFLSGSEGYGIGNTDITISNGHIMGGFNGGISYNVTGGTPHNIRVTGVTASGSYYGIYLGAGNSTVVESCTVNAVAGYGIQASSVSHSTADLCGNTAIAADTASECYAYSTGSDGLVAVYAANNCYGNSDSEGGIYVFGNANNCYGNSNGGGTGLYAAGSAENCYGTSSSGIGLNSGGSAENCYGSSGSGDGLFVYPGNAINCYGNSGGGGYGLFTAGNAENCYGNSSGGDGLHAVCNAANCYGNSYSGNGVNAGGNAANCYGGSGTGNGVNAGGSAENCYGVCGTGTGLFANTANNCSGTSGSGTGLIARYTATGCSGTSGDDNNDGLDAATAINCYGSCTGSGSGSGAGLSANTADNCYGQSTGAILELFSIGAGIVANEANNCYGYDTNAYGILAGTIAIGCYGYGTDGVVSGYFADGVAIGCYGDGPSGSTGIFAYIANSCYSTSGDGGISYKYNMP